MLAGVLVFAGLTDAAAAKGNPPRPGGSAAVAQYVEEIPTSSGSQATGVGKVQTKPLAPALSHRLNKEAGADAPLLQQVATSSAYGAPQRVLHTTKPLKTKIGAQGTAFGRGSAFGNGARGKGTIGGDATPRRALSAAVNVVSDGSDGRLIGLVVVLAAITAVAVAAAAYRQRSLRETARR